MLKKIILLALITAPVVLLCGCAGKKFINVNEILQKPKHGEIYTAYNIWYENPKEISSLNYLKGKIIPFGTVVNDIQVEDDTISFSTKKGTTYNIIFKRDYMMMPIEDFLKQLFTSMAPVEFETHTSPAIYRKLQKGIVEKGMTREQVIKAYGYPAAHRTPALTEDTWVFWHAPIDTIRVVFNGNKVSAIIKL